MRPTVGDKKNVKSPSKSALNDLVAARLKRNVRHGRITIRFAIIDDLCNHIPYCFQKGVDYTLSLHWNVEFLRPTPVSSFVNTNKPQSLKENHILYHLRVRFFTCGLPNTKHYYSTQRY